MGPCVNSSPIPLSMIGRILICTSFYYHHQFEMWIVSHYLGKWWNNGMRSMPGHVLMETFPYNLLFMRGSHRPSWEADISHREPVLQCFNFILKWACLTHCDRDKWPSFSNRHFPEVGVFKGKLVSAVAADIPAPFVIRSPGCQQRWYLSEWHLLYRRNRLLFSIRKYFSYLLYLSLAMFNTV